MVKLARADAGLSLAELAKRAGTSAATLHAYEHGRVQPRIDTLQRVLRAAGAGLELKLVLAGDAGSVAGPAASASAGDGLVHERREALADGVR